MSRENHMTAHLTTMVPQPVQNLPIIEKIRIHIYGKCIWDNVYWRNHFDGNKSSLVLIFNRNPLQNMNNLQI